MRKLTDQDIKLIQLNLLNYVDKICKENNIKYFINYGTLLGAVRHKGFIPWDDDIDISIYREDYDKFISLVNNDKNNKYKILSYKNSNWYFHNFIVIVDNSTTIPDKYKKHRQDTSIFLDIFPIDKFNDTKFIKKIQLFSSLRSIVQTKLKYVTHPNKKISFIKKCLWIILYFVDPRYFTNKIEHILKLNTSSDGKLEGFICLGDINEVFPANTYKETIMLSFEKYMYSAPANYHYILSQLYGNYMNLPPKEQQIKPHNFEAYYKN